MSDKEPRDYTPIIQSLLTSRPPAPEPHPDIDLFDLADIAVRNAKLAADLWRASFDDRKMPLIGNNPTATELAQWRTVTARRIACMEAVRSAARRAQRPAKTPAGIYAKLLIMRASRTGCPVLARSLADDLIQMPALRAVLWPGAAGEG